MFCSILLRIFNLRCTNNLRVVSGRFILREKIKMNSLLASDLKILPSYFCAQTTSVCARPFQRQTCEGRLPTRSQVCSRQGNRTNVLFNITRVRVFSNRPNLDRFARNYLTLRHTPSPSDKRQCSVAPTLNFLCSFAVAQLSKNSRGREKNKRYAQLLLDFDS